MTATKVKDPVCGMEVEAAVGPQREYNGQTYYFCRGGCKGKFDRAPDQYVGEFASLPKSD